MGVGSAMGGCDDAEFDDSGCVVGATSGLAVESAIFRETDKSSLPEDECDNCQTLSLMSLCFLWIHLTDAKS